MVRIVVAIMSMLLCMPPAWGRDPELLPPDGAPNSFETLLADVLEHNPELAFYEAEVSAAQGMRKTAGLWSNPEVNGAFGRKKVTGSDASTVSGSSRELGVTQTVEWPGRIRLRKAIADRDIELAELGLEQFRALLRARVKTAAYALSAAQEKAAATREVAEHFRALREVLIQRDQAGLTPLLETRVIEALELNMQRKASQASLEVAAALFDLNQLRGAAPGTALALTGMNVTFLPLGTETGKLVELAGAREYLVRVRAVELRRERDRVRLAKNERFPAVTAGPAVSQERAGDRERVIGATVSLPLPLWDRNQGNIMTANARLAQAETAFDVARREAERRVVEAIATYDTKVKEMGHWRPDSIQHFREAAELADRHYRLGAVPVSTYIELQSQYLDTIEGLQDTKKEALDAAAHLELMTGTELSLTQMNGSGTP